MTQIARHHWRATQAIKCIGYIRKTNPRSNRMWDLIISPLYDTNTHIEAQKPTETKQFQTSYHALSAWPTKALESGNGPAELESYLSAEL